MTSEVKWLLPEVVISIHDSQIEEHGGLEGVRDGNLLVSAIMRPQNLAVYENPSIFELAASLGFGLAKNHAFNDANKRTASACCITFLLINGYMLEVGQKDLVETTLKLASDGITEQDFAKWLEDNCEAV